ncbi:MAG TPA: TonB-dependent receptor [Steroidobacteraceae bacterium]|nr:TonB-dependent receptor [Steroidobacteraceae bacterium]
MRPTRNRDLVATCLVVWLCSDAHTAATAAEQNETITEVIVTGTRLRVTQADSPAPVTVLNHRDIERTGADSVAKIVQALPMNTGSPVNTNVNNGGDGSARVDLRGFGPQRTLVLLNGRRFPNGGVGGDASVDLNTLPVSWVDRIEVLASGASAVYGADAVGGVVNVITRNDLQGVEFGGSRTITEHGDGEIVRGQASVGVNLLGGSWKLGVDYVEQDGVSLARRSYSAAPLGIIDANGTIGYIGNGAIPEGRFGVPEGNSLGLEPGAYTRVTGARGQTAADYRPFTRDDAFNFAPYNYSQTPNERASVWLLGSAPIAQSSRFFVEALVHQRDSEQKLAPSPMFTHAGDGPALADGTTGVPAENYYNPFGVDIRVIARRVVEQPTRGFTQDLDLWRVLAGVEGEWRDWNWKLDIGRAESDTRNVESGLLLRSRVMTALGPSGPDDSGRIVCGARDSATGRVPAPNIIPDCVPLNLFGGAGTITQEQLAYLMVPLVNSGTNEQDIAEAVLSGRRGQVLGRDVQWVFGAEYRREGGSLIGDPLRAAGTTSGLAQDLPAGSFNARELFGEVELPILHDRAWAHELAVNLGARWSKFSSFDENTALQAGLRWQPMAEITLRANYSEVFRAPSLFELYQSRAAEVNTGLDPCGNEPTPTQQVNCAANGVPGGAYVQEDEKFAIVLGGNPDLQPETGHSVGAGIVYTPAWAPGLSASVDFFDIELSGFIGRPDVDTVLFECAERGSAEVCSAIRRFPDGRPAVVSTVERNLGRVEASGVDAAVNLDTTTRFGDVHVGLVATYLEKWDEQPFPDGEVFHRAGQIRLVDLPSARPRWRAWGHIDWHRGAWHAGYAVEYVGSFSEPVVGNLPLFGIVFDPYIREVESALFHDVEGGYDFGGGLALRAAMTNVTDEDPPFVDNQVDANTDAGTYPLLGRTYFVELRYAFR